MIVEVNKGDWSGEKIKVKVNQTKKSFSLFDYDFTIKVKGKGGKELDTRTFEIVSPDWNYPLAKGTVYEYDGKTMYSFYAFDISRDSENMYESAIQLLCNVI